ncbi:MAG TPA: preprotein translocase subunit SecG [Isosphaeraceae bacterium]|nr:preprotein translocase subunit SecG [Isosphaeraceae bacterium]
MLIGLLNVLLVFLCLTLIFLVLIQRGKGGGLAGAFGGMGGSSAFGTKAGDVFTKITMWVAGIWILVSMALVLLMNSGRTSAWGGGDLGSPGAPRKPAATADKNAGKKSSPATKTADVEVLPAEAPPPAEKLPTAPLNPGDPLAPLPPPEKPQ